MSGTHEVTLILTLAGGLSAALVLGFITQKLHLSPLVGYLLAGVLVGPHSPGFVADAATAAQCAEIGVILLMFGVGLHFHLKDLLAVRNIAVAGAVAQIGLTTVASMGILSLFGFSLLAGAVFGMSVSVASTVVLSRVLSDNHALHTRTGHVALGWLVVEDLFTILLLVLLPAVRYGVPALVPNGFAVMCTFGYIVWVDVVILICGLLGAATIGVKLSQYRDICKKTIKHVMPVMVTMSSLLIVSYIMQSSNTGMMQLLASDIAAVVGAFYPAAAVLIGAGSGQKKSQGGRRGPFTLAFFVSAADRGGAGPSRC